MIFIVPIKSAILEQNVTYDRHLRMSHVPQRAAYYFRSRIAFERKRQLCAICLNATRLDTALYTLEGDRERRAGCIYITVSAKLLTTPKTLRAYYL